MRNTHQAEWEWGWKAPLLFRLPNSPKTESFLDLPLEKLRLEKAEATLSENLRTLKTTRLGIRFERIQSALFQSHPDTADLQMGLVIPGRTEIDLLHRLHSFPGTVIHWELAVKFYLGLDPNGSSDPETFIGPSLKDTLGTKHRTVFSRQLSILKDPLVREKFGSEFGISAHEEILALPKIHGILFDPFEGSIHVHTPKRPEFISPSSLRGVWLPIKRLEEFIETMAPTFSGSDSPWVRLLDDRKDWIRVLRRSEPRPGSESSLKVFLNSPLKTRVQSYFQGESAPIQCAFFSKNTDEELRFFIVPDDWNLDARRVE